MRPTGPKRWPIQPRATSTRASTRTAGSPGSNGSNRRDGSDDGKYRYGNRNARASRAKRRAVASDLPQHAAAAATRQSRLSTQPARQRFRLRSAARDTKPCKPEPRWRSIAGTDILAPYYRDLGLCLGIGLSPFEILLSIFARADGSQRRAPVSQPLLVQSGRPDVVLVDPRRPSPARGRRRLCDEVSR